MFKARNLFWVLALTALWGTASVGQTPPAQRNVYYVSVTGKDSNSGRSLQRAFQTIQRGIQAASAGDIVWVTEGIYAGPGNKNLDFGGRAITVKSTAGPDYTVIDCQNSGRGFVFQSGETRQSVLDGFTVISGNHERGGGIYCQASSPTVKNCVISSCYGFNCGGIYCRDGAAALIQNCTVVGNAGSVNGGIRIVRSNTRVANCVIIDNAAAGAGGGGVRCDYGPGTPTFVNCTIAKNYATENGGGFWAGYGAQPQVKNCILWENTSDGNGHNIAVSTQTTLSVDYSDVQGGQAGVYRIGDARLVWGPGNINVNPLFANTVHEDYHLKSRTGRYVPGQGIWVKDTVNSPCIDAGDPGSAVSLEPMPNGARINQGAFGGMVQASKSPSAGTPPPVLPGDFNGDGIINMSDLYAIIDAWLDLYMN